jgi:uncharacterized membrane protein
MLTRIFFCLPILILCPQSLMGPVTAIAYGISIGDYKMVRMGLVTEVVSLIICIVIGLIFAGAMLPFKVALDWPVEQMTSRGTMTNFWIGFPIAFFSGLGVAVGILDDQTNSLVGVAISASLLPPAVRIVQEKEKTTELIYFI